MDQRAEQTSQLKVAPRAFLSCTQEGPALARVSGTASTEAHPRILPMTWSTVTKPMKPRLMIRTMTCPINVLVKLIYKAMGC